jgi:hypothetical protein
MVGRRFVGSSLVTAALLLGGAAQAHAQRQLAGRGGRRREAGAAQQGAFGIDVVGVGGGDHRSAELGEGLRGGVDGAPGTGDLFGVGEDGGAATGGQPAEGCRVAVAHALGCDEGGLGV